MFSPQTDTAAERVDNVPSFSLFKGLFSACSPSNRPLTDEGYFPPPLTLDIIALQKWSNALLIYVTVAAEAPPL